MDLIRLFAQADNAVIAILGDLSGPKLRVGELPDNSFILRPGEICRFSLDKSHGPSSIPLDFPFLGGAADRQH